MATIFETKVEILNILSDIKSGKIVPRGFIGICGIIHEHIDPSETDNVRNTLKEIFFEWLTSKGLKISTFALRYPVDGKSNYYEQYRKNTLWNNSVRWELLDFMINYLQKEVNNKGCITDCDGYKLKMSTVNTDI